MASLDDYTDEELGRMLRAATRQSGYYQRELVSTLDTFCSWLDVVGLGFISATIKTAAWAYDRVKSIWRSIFG